MKMRAQQIEEMEAQGSSDHITEAYAADFASMANEDLYAEMSMLDEWLADEIGEATGVIAAYIWDEYLAAEASLVRRLVA